jgi:hypothetical protein
MDIDTGDVIVIIGGWFVIGFMVALVLGKILREANELGSQRYHPSEHDNVLFRYSRPRPLKHPVKLRTRGTTPTKSKKKGSKRATA